MSPIEFIVNAHGPEHEQQADVLAIAFPKNRETPNALIRADAGR
jgi:hypothetical protein